MKIIRVHSRLGRPVYVIFASLPNWGWKDGEMLYLCQRSLGAGRAGISVGIDNISDGDTPGSTVLLDVLYRAQPRARGPEIERFQILLDGCWIGPQVAFAPKNAQIWDQNRIYPPI